MFCALSLALLSSTAVHAAPPVLDCNFTAGPLQQAVVELRNGEYTLRELSRSGRWRSRTLTTEELGSKVFQLHDFSLQSPITLSKDQGDWILREGADVAVYGDCLGEL